MLGFWCNNYQGCFSLTTWLGVLSLRRRLRKTVRDRREAGVEKMNEVPWCIEPWVGDICQSCAFFQRRSERTLGSCVMIFLRFNWAKDWLYIFHWFHLNDRGKMHVAYNGPFSLFPVYSSVASSAFALCVPSPPMFRAVSSFQTESS